jgi:hypothetical protein
MVAEDQGPGENPAEACKCGHNFMAHYSRDTESPTQCMNCDCTGFTVTWETPASQPSRILANFSTDGVCHRCKHPWDDHDFAWRRAKVTRNARGQTIAGGEIEDGVFCRDIDRATDWIRVGERPIDRKPTV